MCRETICLVEDKKTIRAYYEQFLIEKGFNVVSFSNRVAAQNGIQVDKISAFILDIVLEGENQGGYLLANHIRSISQAVPIVFLTDNKNEEISGLSRNVNDFIVKGYTDDYLNRFYARISNHIRIYKEAATTDNSKQDNTTIFSTGCLQLDLVRDKVHWQLQPVKLSQLEMKILYCLANRCGSTVCYGDIGFSIEKPHMDNSVLQVHISNIRKAFKEVDNNFDEIVTTSRIGYMWRNTTAD